MVDTTDIIMTSELESREFVARIDRYRGRSYRAAGRWVLLEDDGKTSAITPSAYPATDKDKQVSIGLDFKASPLLSLASRPALVDS